MVLGFRRKHDSQIPPMPCNDEPAASNTSKPVQPELQAFSAAHQRDPNIPQVTLGTIDEAIFTIDDVKTVAFDSRRIEEDSPYSEVRAAVRSYDENVPANTVRAWAIGLLWTTIGSAVNMLFSLRNPSIFLTPIVTLLLSYPFGVGLAYGLPTRKFRTFGHQWTLNPGPFNMKEHTLIIIMANASFGGTFAYSTDVILAQQVYYGQRFGWGYQLLLTITCQLLGFGIAGLTRRWLVEPAAMIWPSTLIITTMFETIHTRETPDRVKLSGWNIGRYRWFLMLAASIFVWEWFPLWIAPVLATFTFFTWVRPKDVAINQVFGGYSGLSLIPITFDWSVITAFVNSPLVYPFHAIANTMIGMLIFMVIVASGVHFSGAFYSNYLPMSTGGSFDNTGARYNVSKILTPEYTLNATAYAAYSPLFLSTTFAISYGLSFASIIAVVVHTVLYHGSDIVHKFKAGCSEGADIHQRLMLKYAPAPNWWFGLIFTTIFALGPTTCLVWSTHLTWWAFILAVFIGTAFFIPIGIIQATTNVQIGLNVITEFVIGYMQPGRPLAMMMFKMYGYISCYQGLYFSQDQKLAHYMKLPPRLVFSAQFVATLWSCIVQIAVLNWALGSIHDVCTLHQANSYTCPNAGVFFTASIIWGVIGPARIFGTKGIYHAMSYFFILGLVSPVLLWLGARRWPKSVLRYISTPVIFGGLGNIPPATVLVYASWGFVGSVFNKYIKQRYPGWWAEFNYITSAALDSGTIICILLVFFALQLPGKVKPPQWWGGFDGGFQDTVDKNATPQVVLERGTFGPEKWS